MTQADAYLVRHSSHSGSQPTLTKGTVNMSIQQAKRTQMLPGNRYKQSHQALANPEPYQKGIQVEKIKHEETTQIRAPTWLAHHTQYNQRV